MSDENRNEAGQFTAAEPLTGREGVEAEFGYKRMPEDEPPSQAAIDIDTAVEELRASRLPEEPIEKIEYLRLDTGETSPENETVSLERAATDLTAYHSNQVAERAKSVSEDFARAIDEMRANALQTNPKAADEYGLSKEEVAAATAAKAAKAEEAAQDEPAVVEAKQATEPAESDAYDSIEGLEPELKEVLRKSPQARQFFENYATEGEQVKEAYATGLTQAQQFGQAAVLALAPELAQVPFERWGEGINILAQSDPARGMQLAAMFSNVAALSQRQQLVTHHQQETARQNFETLRQQYSQQSDKVLGSMTIPQRAQMAEDLVAYLGEHGVSREQIVQETKTNLMLHHPAFNALAVDALKYRAMQKASKAVPTRQLPPVQKPGSSVNRSSGSDISKIQDLQDQLSAATGDRAVKLAAKITAERRRASGR